MTHNYHTVWASILAFVCVLLVLGLLLCIPFSLAKLRGMHPGIDRLMDQVAGWMGATAPSTDSKSHRHPAPKCFLRGLKVAKYKRPDDLEAGAEDCCAICFCEYEPGQPIITLSCQHFFHKECILAWLKVDAVCPICKQQLLPQPDVQQGGHCHSDQPALPQGAAGMSPMPVPVQATSPRQEEPAPASAPASASEPAVVHVRAPVLQPHALSTPVVGLAVVSP